MECNAWLPQEDTSLALKRAGDTVEVPYGFGRRLRSDPTFPRPVVIDGHNYFDEAELDAYDAAHRAPSLRHEDGEELTNTAEAGAT
jgi:hypothetical protein